MSTSNISDIPRSNTSLKGVAFSEGSRSPPKKPSSSDLTEPTAPATDDSIANIGNDERNSTSEKVSKRKSVGLNKAKSSRAVKSSTLRPGDVKLKEPVSSAPPPAADGIPSAIKETSGYWVENLIDTAPLQEGDPLAQFALFRLQDFNTFFHYTKYFYGTDHVNFLADTPSSGPVLVSIAKEVTSPSGARPTLSTRQARHKSMGGVRRFMSFRGTKDMLNTLRGKEKLDENSAEDTDDALSSPISPKETSPSLNESRKSEKPEMKKLVSTGRIERPLQSSATSSPSGSFTFSTKDAPLESQESGDDLAYDVVSDGFFRVLIRHRGGDIPAKIPEMKVKKRSGSKDLLKALIEMNIDVPFDWATADFKELKAAPESVLHIESSLMMRGYKFGVIYCKQGQVTDDDMLSNRETSTAFETFLKLLGDKVELKGFEGYAGGLDVKHGATGAHSVYTSFKDFEIMFHVSTLLPYKDDDQQQLEKKRHIGNDVVVIVFQEGDTPFEPAQIRSVFNHVFIVVRPIKPAQLAKGNSGMLASPFAALRTRGSSMNINPDAIKAARGKQSPSGTDSEGEGPTPGHVTLASVRTRDDDGLKRRATTIMRFPTLGSAMLSPPPVLTLPLDEEIETRPRSDTTVAAVRLVDDGLTVEEQKRLRRTKSQAIDKTELRKRIGSSKKLKDRSDGLTKQTSKSKIDKPKDLPPLSLHKSPSAEDFSLAEEPVTHKKRSSEAQSTKDKSPRKEKDKDEKKKGKRKNSGGDKGASSGPTTPTLTPESTGERKAKKKTSAKSLSSSPSLASGLATIHENGDESPVGSGKMSRASSSTSIPSVIEDISFEHLQIVPESGEDPTQQPLMPERPASPELDPNVAIPPPLDPAFVELLSPCQSVVALDVTVAEALGEDLPPPPPPEDSSADLPSDTAAPADGQSSETTSDSTNGEQSTPPPTPGGRAGMSAEQKRNLLKRQSQYLVKQDKTQQFLRYRIEIVCKEGVVTCEPSLPNPPIFQHGPLLKEFLLTKLINAERASYFSSHFAKPLERTRQMLLQELWQQQK